VVWDFEAIRDEVSHAWHTFLEMLPVERREEWFDISNSEMALLFEACAGHSEGFIDADIMVQTCWDADRLDLGRVGIEPITEPWLSYRGAGHMRPPVPETLSESGT
jgi:hypothetical protein